ncbi:MAG TPA: hydrolase TatD [Bacteroidales bacterium]|nr:MAG: hypothetical protein A2X11_03180 [Bacteroidetes bacterium GWE2_42_24]OFY30434.1 MAG: hypothetical protein A2X09_12665 [Bacteroidetes bacterium GWF2_43_11]PKP24764.1 MAG: hydrolase TatD [Bacteroidetes bacterium HGW-Bacteroidetes-22]HAQ65894.1 hydrolase TatD [Bacteroidales bacterium]HBZ65299.1 hydrolase TatD [Bacteroidales bacterium]
MLTDIHTHRLIPSSIRAIYNVRLQEGVVGLPDPKTLFSVAIHPWDADKSVSWPSFKQLVEEPGCLAIGETGLDKLNGPSIDIQARLFEEQLTQAEETEKPVIIHSVRTQQEVITIVRKHHHLKAFVIHGFSQRPVVARQWLSEGFYLSFGASLLNLNDVLAESLRITPPDRLFLETDDAAVSIESIYQAAAAILNIAPVHLAERIELNFNEVFFHGKLV